VKAHNNSVGNEIADQLAKEAARKEMEKPHIIEFRKVQ
jgi:ribonuclease HI